MSDITIGVIIGGLIVFFLQWAGRHLLDRLVLPRVLDWWARQSSKMALNRAEILLKQFENDVKAYSNIRLFILRIEDRRNKLFSFPFTVALLMIYAILTNQYIPGEKATYGQIAFLLFAIIAICAYWSFGFIYQNRRDYRVFENFNIYRIEIIERVEKLFQAAGLDESAIRERVERLPGVPLPVS